VTTPSPRYWQSRDALQQAAYWAQQAVQLAKEDLRAAIAYAEQIEALRLQILQINMRALRGDPFPDGICPICLDERSPCFAISGNQQVACCRPDPILNPPLYLEEAAGGELLWVYPHPGVYPTAGG